MIFTNTIVKPIFLPSGSNFVWVTVWESDNAFDDKTGLETVKYKTDRQLVNMALIGEIKPLKLETYTNQWFKIDPDNRIRYPRIRDNFWASNGHVSNKISNTREVFLLRPLHRDLELRPMYVTFDNE